MQTKAMSIQRKRMALLILPLVLIPFLTMAFWALGGGKETDSAKENNTGLNMRLPDAQLGDDGDKTKLSFYEAEKKQEGNPSDSSTDLSFFPKETVRDPLNNYANRSNPLYDPAPPASFHQRDPNEEKVYQKLNELNSVLAQSSAKASPRQQVLKQNSNDAENDINRLTAMMQQTQQQEGSDPELDQLNGMMEKILDIQHPERVKEKLNQGKVEKPNESMPISRLTTKATTSLLDTGKVPQNTNAFLSLTGSEAQTSENSIEATVHQTQTLVNGSVITFRLLTNLQVGSNTISKGSLLSGTCSLNEERLEVEISSVRSGSSIYPVHLEVYDLDGIPGLFVPGAISRDVAKGSVDNAAQMLQLSTLDPSLKAQATSAGLGAIKSLLSKKAKLVRVQVKSGYKVLLKEKNA